jgi:FtsH-binding integral membrane protein
VAFYVSSNEQMLNIIFGNRLLFFGLVIGQLVLVFTLSARVHKMQAGTATGLFVHYAALNGVVFASVVNLFLMLLRILGNRERYPWQAMYLRSSPGHS